eukprot:10941310-Lingulodinium_polyedra.AAC.1
MCIRDRLVADIRGAQTFTLEDVRTILNVRGNFIDWSKVKYEKPADRKAGNRIWERATQAREDVMRA